MAEKQLQFFGGSWTEQKLAILAEYLKDYNIALKHQPFIREYVDAFAGTGYRQRQSIIASGIFQDTEDPESQGFIKGSAKLALETEPSFDRFVFIESDARKIEELERLRVDHPGKAIEILQGDANVRVQDYCRTLRTNVRSVVFLDPFATEVQWSTIKAIAGTRRIDVWILFPLMAVNRLLSRDPDKTFRNRLDQLFGTEEWFEHFYRKRREADIFGQEIEEIKKACDFDSISDFYLGRLKAIFAGVAPAPRLLKNSRGSPLFQLFFAAGNTKGAPIAVRIANHLLENM